MRKRACRSRLRCRRVGALLLTLLTAAALPQPGRAANHAVIIGPEYPGGPAFDDTIASTRAGQMAASLAKWTNWPAGNITTLNGGVVTHANIAAAIAAKAALLGPNDIFLLIYHGHGSFTPPSDESVPPAANQCTETIVPSDVCSDDALTMALAAIPARKFIILASCYSGGFWNGQDTMSAGDLEKLANIGLLAGAQEAQCLPEPSAFVNNLLQRLDPAGWPGQQAVTFQQFIGAVEAGAAGSSFNSARWAVSLPVCEMVVDGIGDDPFLADVIDEIVFTPESVADELFEPSGLFLERESGDIPTLSWLGLLVLGAILAAAALWLLGRFR